MCEVVWTPCANESEHRGLLRLLSAVCKADKPGFGASLVFLHLFRNRAFSHPLPSERGKELSTALCVKAWSLLSRRRPRRRRGGGRGTLRDAEARGREEARPNQTTAGLRLSVSSQNSCEQRPDWRHQTNNSSQIESTAANTRDTTNCEVFLCLPVSFIRAAWNEIGGDTRLVSEVCSRRWPRSSQPLCLWKNVDKLPLCGAARTQRTESHLQQMSCGADYK